MYGRTKHMDVKYHFIRGMVVDNTIQLHFCISEDQLAYIFIKSLDTKKQIQFREALGV